jgi:hypothetical protein
MSTTTRKPTAARVKAALVAAGFTESRSYGGRVKSMSAGFLVRLYAPGTIEVKHHTYSARMLPSEREGVVAMLDRYAEAIGAAGFSIELQLGSEPRDCSSWRRWMRPGRS